MKSRIDTSPEALLSTQSDHALHAVVPESFETLLVLIHQCVDAMNIMQQRMVGLEDHARKTVEAIARDKVEARADFATMRTRVKLAESGVDQLAIRLSACEASTLEMTTTHAHEYTAARTEAETWRKKAQDDLAQLAGFDGRLASIETGLNRRLEQAEFTLAATETQVVSLQERAESSEAAAAFSEKKLADANLAMADQRARIACLQAKLAAATDTRRFADPSTITNEAEATAGPDGDIFDLVALVPNELRTSAA